MSACTGKRTAMRPAAKYTRADCGIQGLTHAELGSEHIQISVFKLKFQFWEMGVDVGIGVFRVSYLSRAAPAEGRL